MKNKSHGRNKSGGEDVTALPFKGNLALLIAAVPVVVVGIRIWLYSGGDTETFRLLLRTLNITSVLIATIAYLIPFIIFLFLIVILTDWKVRAKTQNWLEHNIWIKPLIPAAVLVWLYTVSWNVFIFQVGFLFLFVLLYRIITAFWPWGKRNIVDYIVAEPGNENSPDSVITFVSGLIICLLFPLGMWLPVEKLTLIDNTQFAGHVLESNSEWTTIISKEKEVKILSTASLKTREVCSEEDNNTIANFLIPNKIKDKIDC